MAFWGPLSLNEPEDYVSQPKPYEARQAQAPIYQPPQDMVGQGVYSPSPLTPGDMDMATQAEQGPAIGGPGWGGVAGMIEGGTSKGPFDVPGASNPVTGQGIPVPKMETGGAMDAWKRLWPEWGGTGR